MRRSKRRRKPLGEDDVLRAVVCDYVGPAECAINAEAGYTTAVASKAGLVARHTGPQRRMFRAATPRRRPRRTHQRMRAACPMERRGRLAQPREPEQSGRARSGDATRAHGGRGSRRPSQGKPAALALETS